MDSTIRRDFLGIDREPGGLLTRFRVFHDDAALRRRLGEGARGNEHRNRRNLFDGYAIAALDPLEIDVRRYGSIHVDPVVELQFDDALYGIDGFDRGGPGDDVGGQHAGLAGRYAFHERFGLFLNARGRSRRLVAGHARSGTLRLAARPSMVQAKKCHSKNEQNRVD